MVRADRRPGARRRGGGTTVVQVCAVRPACCAGSLKVLDACGRRRSPAGLDHVDVFS